MGLHHVAWDRSSMCPIYQADVVFVRLVLLLWLCLLIDCLQLTVELSWLLLLELGTV